MDYDECGKIMFRSQCHEEWWLCESLSQIYTHISERMKEANENVMKVGLLKGFLNRTLLNEWEMLGWIISRE